MTIKSTYLTGRVRKARYNETRKLIEISLSLGLGDTNTLTVFYSNPSNIDFLKVLRRGTKIYLDKEIDEGTLVFSHLEIVE